MLFVAAISHFPPPLELADYVAYFVRSEAPPDWKGCLFPGAVNFAPGAKESGKCIYHTKGCTSPTALNYNSEAVENDPDNPCVEPVLGCTLSTDSYTNVDAGTPAYKYPVRSFRLFCGARA